MLEIKSVKDVQQDNTETIEELDAVGNIVDTLLKTSKILRIYPGSNPIYKLNLQDTFDKFNDFFNFKDNLTFKISRDHIYYNSESVYNNSQKRENLALLFFKDGIREITFNKDVTCDEIEDFLKIITADFDADTVDDDIVTLFWQRNFKNIKYLADDIVLTDEEVNGPNTITELKQRSSGPVNLEGAYDDSFEEDDIPLSVPIISLTAKDYKQLSDMIEKDKEDKLQKTFNMLFELYHSVERPAEYENIVYFFMKAIEYSIQKGKFQLITDVLSQLKKIVGNEKTDSSMRKSAIKILLFVSGKKMIGTIGNVLEKEEVTGKEVFCNFISSLDRNAISPTLNLLGDLQSNYAKRMIIDTLSSLNISGLALSPENILTIIKTLQHSEWYIVNKMIHFLSRTGDVNLIEYIKKTVTHKDYRVRCEAVRTLGKLGKNNVLGTIRACLDDDDFKVQKAALTVIGNIATDSAKKIIMEQILKSSFISDFRKAERL